MQVHLVVVGEIGGVGDVFSSRNFADTDRDANIFA